MDQAKNIPGLSNMTGVKFKWFHMSIIRLSVVKLVLKCIKACQEPNKFQCINIDNKTQKAHTQYTEHGRLVGHGVI